MNSTERLIGGAGRNVFYLCCVHVNTLATMVSPVRFISENGQGGFLLMLCSCEHTCAREFNATARHACPRKGEFTYVVFT